jgi:hypothetical protein
MRKSVGHAESGSGKGGYKGSLSGVSHRERGSQIKRLHGFSQGFSSGEKLLRKEGGTSVPHGNFFRLHRNIHTPYAAEAEGSQKMFHRGKGMGLSEGEHRPPSSSLKGSLPKIEGGLPETKGYATLLGGDNAKSSPGSPVKPQPGKSNLFPKSMVLHG